MKIGICRHFPVPHNRYKILTPSGFRNWITWYDQGADVRILEVNDETSNWDLCFSSDLQRANTTANTLYKGSIQLDKDLREVPFSVFPFPLPIPVMAWKVLARIGWLLNMKHQTESRINSIERTSKVLKKLIVANSDKNILIVTHGFFMQYLNKEMLKLGFEGKIPVHPKGGTIYSFERK